MYGLEAEFYDITSRSSWYNDKKIIDRIMPLVKNEGVVFDIGAGTGSASIYISEMFDCKRIYAIEKSPEMRIALMSKLQSVIEKKNNVTVLNKSVFDIEFTEDTSAVLLLGVVGHLDVSEREFLWKSLSKKIDKNAPILISNLNRNFFNIKNGTILDRVRVGDSEYELVINEKKYLQENRIQWEFQINFYQGKEKQKKMVYTLEWEDIKNEYIINELGRFGIKGIQISADYILAYKC